MERLISGKMSDVKQESTQGVDHVIEPTRVKIILKPECYNREIKLWEYEYTVSHNREKRRSALPIIEFYVLTPEMAWRVVPVEQIQEMTIVYKAPNATNPHYCGLRDKCAAQYCKTANYGNNGKFCGYDKR